MMLAQISYLAEAGILEHWHALVQESEIITLLLGLTGILVARRLFDFTSRAAARALMAGFWVIIAAYVCTILEGFFSQGSFWNKAFDLTEHLAYAVSACLFVAGVRSLVAERQKEDLSNQAEPL